MTVTVIQIGGFEMEKDSKDLSMVNRLNDAELESIKAGLKDLELGRVHTNEEVKIRIAEKIKAFGDKEK